MTITMATMTVTHSELVAPVIVATVGVERESDFMAFEVDMEGPAFLSHLSITLHLLPTLISELKVVISEGSYCLHKHGGS